MLPVLEVGHNIPQVKRWLASADRQVRFAAVKALTQTARDVRLHEQDVMRKVFDRVTPYAVNALQVKRATTANPVAKVEYKEYGNPPAKRFLNPEVHGGERSQRAHERQLAPLMASPWLAPGKGAELDRFGNIPGKTYTRILSQLKVSGDPLQNATNSKRSRKSRKASAFFVTANRRMIMERKGGTVKPVLVAVSKPSYPKRFPFYAEAEAEVARKIVPNFLTEYKKALATAK